MSNAIAAVSYASTIIVTISTVPSVLRLAKRRRGKPANDAKLYEDEDGVATEESTGNFKPRWYYLSTLVLAIVGLATSLALAIFSTVRVYKQNFGLIAFISPRALAIIRIMGREDLYR